MSIHMELVKHDKKGGTITYKYRAEAEDTKPRIVTILSENGNITKMDDCRMEHVEHTPTMIGCCDLYRATPPGGSWYYVELLTENGALTVMKEFRGFGVTP